MASTPSREFRHEVTGVFLVIYALTTRDQPGEVLGDKGFRFRILGLGFLGFELSITGDVAWRN